VLFLPSEGKLPSPFRGGDGGGVLGEK